MRSMNYEERVKGKGKVIVKKGKGNSYCKHNNYYERGIQDFIRINFCESIISFLILLFMSVRLFDSRSINL